MTTKYARDDVDKFFDYGVSLPTRTIFMGSSEDFDEETGTDHIMSQRMIKGLHLLDFTSNEPITIIMNNLGGDEYHGIAIYDAIKECKSHITIIVYGTAMSMGSIILQAADERVMSPNSRMMIHYGTWEPPHDHPKIVQAWNKEGKRMDNWMIDLYWAKMKEKNSKITKKSVDKMLDFDTFFSPEEAIVIGLSDKVLGE